MKVLNRTRPTGLTLKITKKREGEGIVPSLPFGNIQITQILVKSLMMCLDKEFAARIWWETGICGLDFLILCLASQQKNLRIYAREINTGFEGYKFWL